ncbi:YaiI/YqxD family protein [Maritalea sp.]|uniref:YaiI/YqxD family protein n=1 Tax=Maritalea sp. TaxID=2003361 RepID=UPI003EF3A5EE
MVSIYVDGDACPVKSEIIRVAERHNVKTFIVSNGGLRPSRDPMIQHVIVPHGADVADDWIAENIQANDIAITSDIPLAQRCLDKKARVMGPTGKPFTDANIGMAIAMRGLKQDLRESGEIKGYNPGFTKADRSNFLQVLDRFLSQS